VLGTAGPAGGHAVALLSGSPADLEAARPAVDCYRPARVRGLGAASACWSATPAATMNAAVGSPWRCRGSADLLFLDAMRGSA
jgi:hypothetical protein